MAPHARGLQQWLDVFAVSQPFPLRRRRQLAQVQFAEVHLVGGARRPSGSRQAKND
jgi:hypothetical protein